MGFAGAARLGAAGIAGAAASLAGSAVDAHRSVLADQIEQTRLAGMRLTVVVGASLAALGMVVEAVTLQVRVASLQAAAEEAGAAGDLAAAERIRAHLVTALEEPSASARLMAALADQIPAVLAGYGGHGPQVIEGEVVGPR